MHQSWQLYTLKTFVRSLFVCVVVSVLSIFLYNLLLLYYYLLPDNRHYLEYYLKNSPAFLPRK